MSIRYFPAALLCAALLAPAMTLPALSAPAKEKDGYPNTLMGQCMKEVGAYYDRTYNRYIINATGVGHPQEQRYYDCLSRRYNETNKPRKPAR